MIDRSLIEPDAEYDIEERFRCADRVLCVYDTTNAEIRCDADDERKLRDEMRDYAESGRNRLIDLTAVWGSEVTVLASTVVNWVVTTRDTRLMSRVVVSAIEAEKKRRDMLTGGND